MSNFVRNNANLLIFHDFNSNFVNFIKVLSQRNLLSIKYLNQQVLFLKKQFNVKKHFLQSFQNHARISTYLQKFKNKKKIIQFF